MKNHTQRLLAVSISLILVVGITPAFADPANLGTKNSPASLHPLGNNGGPSSPAVFFSNADFTVTGDLAFATVDCYSFDAATSVGASPGDNFFAAIDNDIGGPNPDTNLGMFSAAGCDPSDLIDYDDDSSPFGDGLADAIGGVVNLDGFIYLGVTGCCDDFDGTHDEEGPYDLSVVVGGEDNNNSLGTAEIISGCAFTSPEPSDVTPRQGSVTATIARTGGINDVDFYQFSVPLGGASLIADIDNDPFVFDTVLSVFNSDGTLIAEDDDTFPADDGSDDSLDSFVGQLILANPGTYYVAVSQYSNFPNADGTCSSFTPLDIGGDETSGCTFGDSSFQESGGDVGLPYNLHLSLLDAGVTCNAVGGELLPIDSTALILAGAQTNAVWIMSALAVIGSVAFGALYITTKKN